MNYTLEWTPTALNQLTAAWLAATNRNAVTEAAHRLEFTGENAVNAERKAKD